MGVPAMAENGVGKEYFSAPFGSGLAGYSILND